MTPIERKARELLPCPWCGEALSDCKVSDGSTFRWRMVVGCCTDGPEVRHNTMADDQAEAEADSTRRAIEAWNTRAALTPPAGGLPELPEPALYVGTKPVPYEARMFNIAGTREKLGYTLSPSDYFSATQLHAYALEAIAASRVGWLPIESAPMSGEPFLGCSVHTLDTEDFPCMWSCRFDGYMGYFRSNWDHEPLHQLTHWQPLPAAPQVALNRGGEEGK